MITFFLAPLPDLKSSQDCCFFCVTLSISWKRCLLLKLFCSFFLRAFVFSSSVSLIATHCNAATGFRAVPWACSCALQSPQCHTANFSA